MSYMKKSFFIVMLLVLACSKNSNQHSIIVPDVIQAENRRGNIMGGVRLFDKDGKSLEDGSGVTITIAQSNVSTQSDKFGKWKLDSIPFGTYDLILSKPGYGTSRIKGLYHAASNHATTLVKATTFMSMISDMEITNFFTRKSTEVFPIILSLVNTGAEDGIIFYPGFKNISSKEKPVRFFMSTSPDVSPTNYMVTEKQFYTGKITNNENDNFKTSWFIAKGLQPGTTVYVKAYGDGSYTDDYEDPITGLTVFPCLAPNGSKVISFVVPVIQ
jgi:hypothetical protein